MEKKVLKVINSKLSRFHPSAHSLENTVKKIPALGLKEESLPKKKGELSVPFILLNRELQLGHMASYPGIRQVTLSRIRAEVK